MKIEKYVLFNNKKIKIINNKLDLSNLKIKHIKEIKGLENLILLKTLIFSNNKIEKIEGLSHLKFLQTLALDGNKISIIENLNNLKNLQVLLLNDNNITIINGLENLHYLKKLDLSNNKIKLIEDLENLNNLIEINLEKNNIHDEDINLGDSRAVVNYCKFKKEQLKFAKKERNFHNGIFGKINRIEYNDKLRLEEKIQKLTQVKDYIDKYEYKCKLGDLRKDIDLNREKLMEKIQKLIFSYKVEFEELFFNNFISEISDKVNIIEKDKNMKLREKIENLTKLINYLEKYILKINLEHLKNKFDEKKKDELIFQINNYISSYKDDIEKEFLTNVENNIAEIQNKVQKETMLKINDYNFLLDKINNHEIDDNLEDYNKKKKDIISHLKQLISKDKQKIKIKKTVLDLGVKFTRLQAIEIAEKCGIENEDFIISILKEMIKNKEIYAEFFKSTKSIAFNQQANIEELEKLDEQFESWTTFEENKTGKVNNIK